eukprot:COSAG02_NODE_36953_length_448_cov_0.908309_1_plen_120_part_01
MTAKPAAYAKEHGITIAPNAYYAQVVADWTEKHQELVKGNTNLHRSVTSNLAARFDDAADSGVTAGKHAASSAFVSGANKGAAAVSSAVEDYVTASGDTELAETSHEGIEHRVCAHMLRA